MRKKRKSTSKDADFLSYFTSSIIMFFKVLDVSSIMLFKVAICVKSSNKHGDLDKHHSFKSFLFAQI